MKKKKKKDGFCGAVVCVWFQLFLCVLTIFASGEVYENVGGREKSRGG